MRTKASSWSLALVAAVAVLSGCSSIKVPSHCSSSDPQFCQEHYAHMAKLESFERAWDRYDLCLTRVQDSFAEGYRVRTIDVKLQPSVDLAVMARCGNPPQWDNFEGKTKHN